jgi:DNA/RNA endonuclease G (NUC1)
MARMLLWCVALSNPSRSDPLDYIKKFQVTVQAVEDVINVDFLRALPAGRRRPVETQCAEMIR